MRSTKQIVRSFRAERVRARSNATADTRLAIATLYEGLFSLAVPLTAKVQQAIDQQMRDPRTGLINNDERELNAATRTLITLGSSSCPSSSHQFRWLLRASAERSLRGIDLAIDSLMRSNNPLKMVAWEYALHRRDIYRLNGFKHPSRTVAGVVISDMRKGRISSLQIGFKLGRVLPAVSLDHRLDPSASLLRRTLEVGRLLPAVARQKGPVQFAWQRIVTGTNEFSFHRDDSVVRTSAPHRDFLPLYRSVEQFRASHWNDMWFQAPFFTMYGTDTRAEMGNSFDLAHAVDPLTGVQVKDLISKHRRLGCPILVYGGARAEGSDVADILATPDVWKPLLDWTERHHTVTEHRPLSSIRDWPSRHYVPDAFTKPIGIRPSQDQLGSLHTLR